MLSLRQGHSTYPTPTLEKREFLLKVNMPTRSHCSALEETPFTTFPINSQKPRKWSRHSHKETHIHTGSEYQLLPLAPYFDLGIVKPRFLLSLLSRSWKKTRMYGGTTFHHIPAHHITSQAAPRTGTSGEWKRLSDLPHLCLWKHGKRLCWGALMVQNFIDHFFLHPNIDKDWILGKL